MKKLLYWVFGILLVIIVIGRFLGNEKQSTIKVEANSVVKPNLSWNDFQKFNSIMYCSLPEGVKQKYASNSKIKLLINNKDNTITEETILKTEKYPFSMSLIKIYKYKINNNKIEFNHPLESGEDSSSQGVFINIGMNSDDPSYRATAALMLNKLKDDLVSGKRKKYTFDGKEFYIGMDKDESKNFYILLNENLNQIKIEQHFFFNESMKKYMDTPNKAVINYHCEIRENETKKIISPAADINMEACYKLIVNNYVDSSLKNDKPTLENISKECQKKPKFAVCINKKIFEARRSMSPDEGIRSDVIAEWEQECDSK